jgi:hypothetical protein
MSNVRVDYGEYVPEELYGWRFEPFSRVYFLKFDFLSRGVTGHLKVTLNSDLDISRDPGFPAIFVTQARVGRKYYH